MMNSTSRIVDNRRKYYAKCPHSKDPKGIENFIQRFQEGVRLQQLLRTFGHILRSESRPQTP